MMRRPPTHPDGGRSQRIAGRLEEDVPRDVEDGGARDEDEDEGVHPRSLRTSDAGSPRPRSAGATAASAVSARRRAGRSPRLRAGARRSRSRRRRPSRPSPRPRPSAGRGARSARAGGSSPASLSAGTRKSIRNVTMTTAATASPANDVLITPPTARPTPARASGVEPDDDRAEDRGGDVAAGDRRHQRPTPSGDQERQDADRPEQRRDRRRWPSGPATSARRAAPRAGRRSRPTPSR